MLSHDCTAMTLQRLQTASRSPKAPSITFAETRSVRAAGDPPVRPPYTTSSILRCDRNRPSLERVHTVFELPIKRYVWQGVRGCLQGALEQEPSGARELFRLRVAGCLDDIVLRNVTCLERARCSGDLPPSPDLRKLAEVLVDCSEGVVRGSRLPGSSAVGVGPRFPDFDQPCWHTCSFLRLRPDHRSGVTRRWKGICNSPCPAAGGASCDP